MRKQRRVKAGAILTAAVLLAASVNVSANMSAVESLAAEPAAQASEKTTTVYVIRSAEGEQITASSWLSNPDGAAQLEDQTTLHDVEVVRGDASLETAGADGALVWNTAGGDVYYRGTASAELPLDAVVRCTLDGTQIRLSDAEGESGHLVITIDYENHLSTVAGGRTIWTPYLMASGVLFENDSVDNVTVTNGEAINDGARTIAVGIGFPGLAESLGVNTPDQIVNLEIPDQVVIECDVTDCPALSVLTMATVPDLHEFLEDAPGSGNLEGDVDEMADGMRQLIEGASALQNGTDQFAAGTARLALGASELSGGTTQLSSGVEMLSSGALDLSEGMTSAHTGARQLAAGTTELASGTSDLASGASDLADGTEALAPALPR